MKSRDNPYANHLRAYVPLQERNEAFAPTQANPKLNSETSLTNLNGDYGGYVFDNNSYTNEFSQYLYNFWQYTDYYGGWHGMATAEVPFSLYDESSPTEFEFEFGILNLPNPAYTNAAHKNGVKSIGCLFIPRAAQPYKDLLKKDENGEYIVAKKLIEIKEYFGFDGYFINQETSVDPSHIVPYKEFTKTLVYAGVYTQWYDCIDDVEGKLTYKPSLIQSHSSFVKDESLGRVNDSIFMNYNWNSPDGWNNGDSTNQEYINASLEEAKRLGINPLDSVLMGVEVNMGKFDGSHNSTRNMDVICDEDGNPKTGIALFTPDYVMSGLDEDLDMKDEYPSLEDDYQWMVAERERMFYTGVTIDPLDVGEKEGYSRPDVGVKDASQWGGVSKYISERSVIRENTFITNFNTGHGMDYYINGEISNSEEWSNINIQDILPTWQWWIETDGTRLQADFDYGSDIENGEKFTYKQIGGYKGGSSLVVNGKLDSNNLLRLYKTDLDLNENSKASITFKKVSNDKTSKMKLALIFKDDPENVVYLDIDNSNKKSKDWITSEIDLSGFKGRKIATMGLGFESTEVVDDYQVNIGEIKITDGTSVVPEAPTGFKVSKAMPKTNEAYVEWDLESYDTVKQYNLYAIDNSGKDIFLGGIYDQLYYIKNMPKNTVSLKLTAVGEDGSESEASIIKFSFDKKLSNIQVEENVGYIDVSWKKPNIKFESIRVDVNLDYSENDEVYSTKVKNGKSSARIEVPITDGSRYTLTISMLDSNGNVIESINYISRLLDLHSSAYDGTAVLLSQDKVKLTAPTSSDWWHMYIYEDDELKTHTVNGETLDYYVRGVDDLESIPVIGTGKLTVIVEDYNGNKSEAVEVLYGNNINASEHSTGEN